MKSTLMLLLLSFMTAAFAAEKTVEPPKAKADDVKWTLLVLKGTATTMHKQYKVENKSIQLDLPDSKWSCSTERGEHDGKSAAGIACKSGDLVAVLPGICTEMSKVFTMNIASGGQLYTLQLICN